MKWTPQTVYAGLIVLTICVIFIMIEFGILRRSEQGDVDASRNLLDGNIKLLIGLLAGFIVGKHVEKPK